jgi:hypothetical protein
MMLWIAIATGLLIIALFLYFRFRTGKRIENNIAF